MTTPPSAPSSSAAIERGRVNIAFTEPAASAARQMTVRLPVAELVEAARMGVAYALRHGMKLHRPDDFGATNGSNFNVGSVDPGGELRELLLALHPDLDEDPYRVIETLMSLGVLAINDRITSGDILTLRDLISEPESDT